MHSYSCTEGSCNNGLQQHSLMSICYRHLILTAVITKLSFKEWK